MPGAGDRPVALVTGGSRRVGRAICIDLARSGWDIILTHRDSSADAERTARDVEGAGGSARALRLDLGDPRAVEASAASLARELPRLDGLVLSAAAYGPTPTAKVSAQEAIRYFTVNALSALLLSRGLAERLARSTRPGGGSIVALADMHVLGRPRTGHVAYSMSKAALVELVRVLARELAPRIRVNAVAPGVAAFPEQGPEADAAWQARYLVRVPMGRAGTPAEAAAAVRFLLADATYVTGEVIRVDGGGSLA
jgi:pteridine reductase